MNSRTIQEWARRALTLTSLFAISCIGCEAPPGNGDGGNDIDSWQEQPAANPPALDNLRVQFRNLSSVAVDTQFHVSDENVANLPDDLLVPDNLVCSGIGIGGTGLIGPLSVDEIELPCTEQLIVGTAGGEFIDPDLGTPLGNGSVRFMQAGFQFDCGDTLVFEYSETIGGYTVNLFQDN